MKVWLREIIIKWNHFIKGLASQALTFHKVIQINMILFIALLILSFQNNKIFIGKLKMVNSLKQEVNNVLLEMKLTNLWEIILSYNSLLESSYQK